MIPYRHLDRQENRHGPACSFHHWNERTALLRGAEKRCVRIGFGMGSAVPVATPALNGSSHREPLGKPGGFRVSRPSYHKDFDSFQTKLSKFDNLPIMA